jgi:hypothetical protein
MYVKALPEHESGHMYVLQAVPFWKLLINKGANVHLQEAKIPRFNILLFLFLFLYAISLTFLVLA